MGCTPSFSDGTRRRGEPLDLFSFDSTTKHNSSNISVQKQNHNPIFLHNKPRTISQMFIHLSETDSIDVNDDVIEHMPEKWLKGKEKDYLYDKKIYYKKYNKSFVDAYAELQTDGIPIIVTSDSLIYLFNKIREKCIVELEENLIYMRLNELCIKMVSIIKNMLENNSKKLDNNVRNILLSLQIFFSIPYAILNVGDLNRLTGVGDYDASLYVLEMMNITCDPRIFMTTARNILECKTSSIKFGDISLQLNGDVFKLKKYDRSSLEFKKYYLALMSLMSVEFEINNKTILTTIIVSKLFEVLEEEFNFLESLLNESIGLTKTKKINGALLLVNEIKKITGQEKSSQIDFFNWAEKNIYVVSKEMNSLLDKYGKLVFKLFGDFPLPTNNINLELSKRKHDYVFSIYDLMYTMMQNDTARNKMKPENLELLNDDFNLLKGKYFTLSNSSFNDQYIKLLRSLTSDTTTLRNIRKNPFSLDVWKTKQLKTQIGAYIDFEHTELIVKKSNESDRQIRKTSISIDFNYDKDVIIEPINLFWNDLLAIVHLFKDLIKKVSPGIHCELRTLKQFETLEKILKIIIKHDTEKFQYILPSYISLFIDEPHGLLDNVAGKYFSTTIGKKDDICYGIGNVDVMFIELDNGKRFAGPVYATYEFISLKNTKSDKLAGYVDFNEVTINV